MNFENGPAIVCKGCENTPTDREGEYHFFVGGVRLNNKGKVLGRVPPPAPAPATSDNLVLRHWPVLAGDYVRLRIWTQSQKCEEAPLGASLTARPPFESRYMASARAVMVSSTIRPCTRWMVRSAIPA